MKNKLLATIILLVIPTLSFSAIKKININQKFPVLQAENHTWIGTPAGLFQYNFDDNTFKRFSIPTRFQSNEVRQLHFYEEWLWCVLDSGMAALHVRLNEWLFFDSDNGLPSNKVNCVDFLGDYVWISTDNGAARFDLLIEEWEIYDKSKGMPESDIKDIVVLDERVWFEMEKTFSEYDADFEKYRHFRVEKDTSAVLKRMFLLGEEIWFLANKGLIRFDPGLQTQQPFFQTYLQHDNILEIIVENDRLWIFSRMGLFFYEQQTGVWREFEGNSYLKTSRLVNGYVTNNQIWILTDRNVLVWERSQKSWEILDYASGLSASEFAAAYSTGSLVFLLNQDNVEYRRTELEPWRKHEIRVDGGRDDGAGRNIIKNLFDNEAGGKIPLGKYDWAWEGSRITLLYDGQQRFNYQGEADDAEINSGERLDVKSQLNLGESRSITGFYNNIDYSETMYGLRYRSREQEFIREFNWGDFRLEPGNIPFGETANVFGSNIWLHSGPKTERFKRSRFTMKAQTGEQRSRKTYENFQGTTDEFNVIIVDTNFVANQFYSLPGLDTLNSPENIAIYIDDLNSYNNTPNTKEHFRIAGIDGDFDLWKATEEYHFYKKANAIRFLKYVNPEWTIVARCISQGTNVEIILQYGGNVSTVLKNFYYLNAQKIIPYSFQLTIKDILGQSVPLNSFQIDADGDGKIDSPWIDFENGILFFPEAEPFPAEVYDPVRKQSNYTMEVEFQTELSLIQLKQKDLVRSSETVRLDGLIAAGGNDYVLDYTNGTLIFVREGVLNPDTRIEIEYEYYLNEKKEQLSSASFNWSPSDNFYAQTDWLQFSSADTSKENPTNLFSVFSEVRQKVGEYDVRLIPGLAYHPGESGIAATNFEGFVSSAKFRFQTVYQNYSENYQNLYRLQSLFGDVKSNLRLFTTVDVRNDLRLTGEWKKVQGFSLGDGFSPVDRSGNLSFLFHRQGLPGWQFSCQNFETNSDGNTTNKHFFQNRWEYQLPLSWVQKIGLQGLKIEGFLRSGQQSGFPTSGSLKQQFRQGNIRMNAQIKEQFQTSLFYRRNDLNDISSAKNKAPISRSERLLMALTHEEYRLIQLNLRVENSVSQYFHQQTSLKNVRSRQFSQINVRFSPGQLHRIFSRLNFEFNINQTLTGWGETGARVNNWVWQVFGQSLSKLADYQLSQNFYIKNEFRPGARWLVFSLLEKNDQKTGLGSSILKRDYYRLNEKVDIKIGFKTRLNLNYRQFYQNQGYARVTRYSEPSIWIEQRWTPDFQNILNLLYRKRWTDDGQMRDVSHNLETSCELVWRKYNFLRMRRLELRQNLTAAYYRTSGYNQEQNYRYGASLSLDLYPLHSMIIRTRFDFNQYLDDLIPEYAYYSFAGNLKVSFRF